MEDFQRELLWLLHSLHANLIEEESEWHRLQADAYESGATSFYGDRLSDEITEEVQEETYEILRMFSWLGAECKQLNASDLLVEQLSYQGFDHNNDEHSRFVNVLRNRGCFQELNLLLNSHSRATISMYRRMLSAYRNIDRSNATIETLETIAAAITNPSAV